VSEQDGATADRGVFGRLYHGETNVDFIGRRWWWFALSAVVIVAGLVSLGTRGLNLGIDFEGGTAWEVPAGDASVADATEAVEAVGLGEARVQTLSSGGDERLLVRAEPDEDVSQEEVSEALAEVTGNDVGEVSVNEVGPSWGREITEKAQRALVVFLVLITLYITVRFEWKMALATLAALIHDILVTVGVYSLAGFEVTPATVIAILTILGYSIYDGIVVFDRVDENAKALASGGRITYSEMVNTSLNEVLMRTLNTSITALLPILSLLVIGSLLLGASTLEEFALALFIGLGSGAYSSIFIASPLLAVLKEREERWRALRRRIERGGGPLVPTGGSGARGRPPPAERDAEGDGGGDRPLVRQTTGAVAPRPRKRTRRR
jgi:preprotein translocase subunit SecF